MKLLIIIIYTITFDYSDKYFSLPVHRHSGN